MVKFWHEGSAFTLGCVGYTFGLSLEWKNFSMSVQCLHRVVFGTHLCWVLSGRVLAQAFSVYTGWCWVKVWVES